MSDNPDLFREIIPSILNTKENVFVDEGSYKAYVPYLVNKAVGAHLDCVMQANAMNMYPSLPKEVQYQYLLNSTRGYKRKFQPWFKKDKIEDISIVQEYFQVSFTKARSMVTLLSSDQLNKIRSYLDKGGQRSGNE